MSWHDSVVFKEGVVRFSIVGRKACIVASFLASASIAFAAPPASASSADWGYITGLYGTNNGAVLFSTSGARTTPPACQTGGAQRFAIDASTTAGQAAASVLLNAYNLHRKVWVQGMGACGIWGDTETVTYFQVADS